jgi:hypothetical protein
MADHVHRPSPGGAKRRQDAAGRPFHWLPRKQFACLHNDNRSLSLQDNGRGEFRRGYAIRAIRRDPAKYSSAFVAKGCVIRSHAFPTVNPPFVVTRQLSDSVPIKQPIPSPQIIYEMAVSPSC